MAGKHTTKSEKIEKLLKRYKMWGVAVATPYVFMENENKKWYNQIKKFIKLENQALYGVTIWLNLERLHRLILRMY